MEQNASGALISLAVSGFVRTIAGPSRFFSSRLGIPSPGAPGSAAGAAGKAGRGAFILEFHPGWPIEGTASSARETFWGDFRGEQYFTILILALDSVLLWTSRPHHGARKIFPVAGSFASEPGGNPDTSS